MVPDAGRTMSAAPSIESGALARAFAERGERALLAAFMTAGFPARDDTGDALEALAAGADIIEVGAPFSDPAADGTAIQRASERALANGMTLRLALSQIRAFRARRNTPVVVMGYANSFLAHCRAAAANARADLGVLAVDLAAAGVNGIIVVDLADSDADRWRPILRAAGVDLIPLVAPTTPAARVRAIAAKAEGFLYFVSLKGVTGAGHLDIESVAPQIARVRQIAAMPVAAGFGVRAPSQARELAAQADGVVVGSRFIEVVEEAERAGGDWRRALAAAAVDFRAALGR